MKISVAAAAAAALVSAVLLQVVACSQVHYEVPEPLFEVFSPKGLRVSLPDCIEIKSVEFFLNVPRVSEPLVQEVKRPDGAFWVYWNPDVVVHPQEKIVYKLMVRKGDLYWKKEGVHVVDKVKGLANDTDCSEDQGQKIISEFPSFEGSEDRYKGMLTSGRTSSFKSAYSMQKSPALKPITKSSTSTTSGTFYVKPSGVMEATGFKRESSYDSTKREGEQWKHYEAELTAEELENMRRLYGPDFYGFPHLSGKLFPTTGKIYEKSYMSSESQQFPGELRYAETPLTTHQFHSTHRTQESSSVSNSKPVFQFHYGDAFRPQGSFETSQKEERQYRVESVNNLPKPLPPHGTMFRATEYVREEHTPIAQTESSQTFSGRETHTGTVAPQKIVQVSQTGEYSSHNQEIVKPSFKPFVSGGGGTVSRVNQLEYNSGNLQTIQGRGDLRSRHYVGSIFTSVKNMKVKSPDECTLIPGVDYTPSGNVREVEKFAFELSCLATLAESSMKEEIALLKQKNAELSRKFELLEHELKRLSADCNCYE